MYYNINFSKYVVITMNFKGGKFSWACLLTMTTKAKITHSHTSMYEKVESRHALKREKAKLTATMAHGIQCCLQKQVEKIQSQGEAHQMEYGHTLLYISSKWETPEIPTWVGGPIWTIGIACSTHAYHAYQLGLLKSIQNAAKYKSKWIVAKQGILLVTWASSRFLV